MQFATTPRPDPEFCLIRRRRGEDGAGRGGRMRGRGRGGGGGARGGREGGLQGGVVRVCGGFQTPRLNSLGEFIHIYILAYV